MSIQELQKEIIKQIYKQAYKNVLDLIDRYDNDLEKVKEWIMVSNDIRPCLSPETRLYDLESLSIRSINAIQRIDGIDWFKSNLKDLSNISETELIRLNQVGRGTINEIQKLLGTVGLKLQD